MDPTIFRWKSKWSLVINMALTALIANFIVLAVMRYGKVDQVFTSFDESITSVDIDPKIEIENHTISINIKREEVAHLLNANYTEQQ